MKNFPIEKYKFVVHNRKTNGVEDGFIEVIAITTYAGKTVRGVATCDPRDKFDLAKGKIIAAARCNLKVAEKRAKRASIKYDSAYTAWSKAVDEVNRFGQYYDDAMRELVAAKDKVNCLEDVLKD